jgi:hypothetical protein
MSDATIFDDKRRRGPTLITGPQVLQEIVDRFCGNPSMPTTRADLINQLAVSAGIVDDHVKKLIAKGRVRKILNGVLVPTQIRPDRAVSVTRIPGGDTKVEIGDACLDLSKGEIRDLVAGLGGVMTQDLRAELREIRDLLGI